MVLPAGNVVGLAPKATPRGSVGRALPESSAASGQTHGFSKARFEGDPRDEREWASVCRWHLNMPQRTQDAIGYAVKGDYKAIGLVDGSPVYERCMEDGHMATIGWDAMMYLDLYWCFPTCLLRSSKVLLFKYFLRIQFIQS